MARLFVLSGPDVGKSFEVGAGARVGRSPECDVRLRDRSISRGHAHFEVRGGVWFVIDDDSRNGLARDGARAREIALDDEAEFKIGDLLVRFRSESEPAPAPNEFEPNGADADDEIVLEGPDEPPPPPARRPAPVEPRPAPAPSRAAPNRAVPSRAAPGARTATGLEQRGGVLQYHKHEARGGLLVADLDQYPAWVRFTVGVLAVGFLVAIAWLAFRGVVGVRQSTQPAVSEVVDG